MSGDERENDETAADNEPDWVRAARQSCSAASTLANHNAVHPLPRSAKRGRRSHRPASRFDDDPTSALLKMVRELDQEEDAATGQNCHPRSTEAMPPPRRVYYCSRTHSQLAQVMGELDKIVRWAQRQEGGAEKRCPATAALLQYSASRVRATTLASRKTACINPGVRKLSSAEAVNQKCQELVAEDQCPFYNCDKDAALEELLHSLSDKMVVDIEEAVRLGSHQDVCPYYGIRSFATQMASIVTAPYATLLSRPMRESLGIDVRGAVLIFDEGHNLVDAINELNSVTVPLADISLLFEGLWRYLDKFDRRLAPPNLVLLQQLQHILSKLVALLGALRGEGVAERIWSSSEFLSLCEIDHINMLKIVDYIRDHRLSVKLLPHYQQGGDGEPAEATESGAGGGPIRVADNFSRLLQALMAADRSGRILFRSGGRHPQEPAVLRYIALDPAEAMRELVQEAHSVILAGGTMKTVGGGGWRAATDAHTNVPLKD